MKTVLITGASSGIGEGTGRLFVEKGWNVVATARSQERLGPWAEAARVLRLSMDVTVEAQIRTAVTEAVRCFGRLDVLINNAGAGLAGAFESVADDQLRRLFDVNFFGAASMIRAVAPLMRAQGDGVIINVTSITGRVGLPFMSPYDATKFALEGLSESLRYELALHGVKVKLVEPGGVKTAFSHQWVRNAAYDPALDRLIRMMTVGASKAKGPQGVVQAIYKAATDGSGRLRYTANGSGPLIVLNRLVPESVWGRLVASNFLKSKSDVSSEPASPRQSRN